MGAPTLGVQQVQYSQLFLKPEEDLMSLHWMVISFQDQLDTLLQWCYRIDEGWVSLQPRKGICTMLQEGCFCANQSGLVWEDTWKLLEWIKNQSDFYEIRAAMWENWAPLVIPFLRPVKEQELLSVLLVGSGVVNGLIYSNRVCLEADYI